MADNPSSNYQLNSRSLTVLVMDHQGRGQPSNLRRHLFEVSVESGMRSLPYGQRLHWRLVVVITYAYIHTYNVHVHNDGCCIGIRQPVAIKSNPPVSTARFAACRMSGTMDVPLGVMMIDRQLAYIYIYTLSRPSHNA